VQSCTSLGDNELPRLVDKDFLELKSEGDHHKATKEELATCLYLKYFLIKDLVVVEYTNA